MGKEEPSLEELLNQMKDEDEEKREEAAESLIVLGDKRVIEPLTKIMKEISPLERGDLISIIGGIGGKEAVKPLIFALTDNKYDDRILPDDFEDEFRINEELIALRNLALKYLEKIGDKRAIEPIISLLKDSDKRIRSLAAETLTRFDDKRAIEPLVQILDNLLHYKGDMWYFSPKMESVEAEIKALIKLDRERVFEHLEEAINSDYWGIRQNAVIILGQIGGKRAVELVAQMIDDKDYDVRVQVFFVLGILRDKETITILKKTLKKETDFYLKNTIKSAIEEIKSKKPETPKIFD